MVDRRVGRSANESLGVARRSRNRNRVKKSKPEGGQWTVVNAELCRQIHLPARTIGIKRLLPLAGRHHTSTRRERGARGLQVKLT